MTAMVGLVMPAATATSDALDLIRIFRSSQKLVLGAGVGAGAFGSMMRARQSASIQCCSCCRAATPQGWM